MTGPMPDGHKPPVRRDVQPPYARMSLMDLKTKIEADEYVIDHDAVARAMLRRSPLVLEPVEPELDAFLEQCQALLALDDPADPDDAG
jgi:hypothetical protein